jgi:hypothetical protein
MAPLIVVALVIGYVGACIVWPFAAGPRCHWHGQAAVAVGSGAEAMPTLGLPADAFEIFRWGGQARFAQICADRSSVR